MRKSIKKVLSISLALGFLIGGLSGCTTEPAYTAEQLATAKDQAYLKGVNEQVRCEPTVITETITEDCPIEVTECPVIEDYQEAECAIDRETSAGGYQLEDLEIGVEMECITLTDKEIGLFDGEIRFDREDYDVEEIVTVCPIIGANEEEYNGETYLQFNEEGISYGIEIDTDLDTSDIEEDETLELKFLGIDYEIIEWDGDTIQLFKGIEETLSTGGSIEVDGKTVTVGSIGKDAISVTVGSTTGIVEVGDIRDIEDIQIEIIKILDTDTPGKDQVTIRAGEDIFEEIEDGDEYAEDSMWDRVITDNYFGIT